MNWDKIGLLLTSHWPFLAVALILGIVGEVAKGVVLGQDNEKTEHSAFARAFKRTLPVHPIVVGGLLGLILGATIPEVVEVGGVVSSILYFAVSGAISSTFYSTIKGLKPELAKALRRKVASLGGNATVRTSTPPQAQKEDKEEGQDVV